MWIEVGPEDRSGSKRPKSLLCPILQRRQGHKVSLSKGGGYRR